MSQHEPKPHDPQHPYALKFIGCGHGVLFVNECVDCEIVGLIDEYKRAVKKVARVRDRLRVLGAPMPGQTSLPSNAGNQRRGNRVRCIDMLEPARSR